MVIRLSSEKSQEDGKEDRFWQGVLRLSTKREDRGAFEFHSLPRPPNNIEEKRKARSEDEPPNSLI